jgi:AraC-like DNA-binding protein
MDYPIIIRMAGSAEAFESYFHTPSEMARDCLYCVVRGGHLRAAPDYRIERRSVPGHDLLLCIGGGGCVLSGGREFPVSVGQLAWIDGYHPHAHWAEPGNPWELLWVRVDGLHLDRVAGRLSVGSSPVFGLADYDGMRALFRCILNLLRDRPASMEAMLHAEIAALISRLCVTPQEEKLWAPSVSSPLPRRLEGVFTRMRLYYHQPWQVEELASLAGMSASHFFRCFRKAAGASPIDWLRRERINQAKLRLVETRDQIHEIAEQVGYRDPYYFSREFKRLTGSSPRQFRAQEQERATHECRTR